MLLLRENNSERKSLNSKLRNAIGYRDVDYETVSQVITYIPKLKNRKWNIFWNSKEKQ